MATDTARATPPRQLWQVPMFLVGAVVLAAVPLTRPYWNPEDAPAIERQLRAARAALDAKEPDLHQAIQRGTRVLAYADRYPQFAGPAHFVVGSASLKVADDPATTDVAAERKKARDHLEKAEVAKVPDVDKPKLTYRLGKVWQLTGADVVQTIAALTKAADVADDPAEGYGLLAQAYLRQQPPDQAAALDATKQQLAKAMPTSDPKVLSQARFRLGELYLAVKDTKNARLYLGKIEADAPPEQFFAARRLLATSYEETQEWPAAARNWEQTRKDPALKPAEKAAILYRLGRCYAQEPNPAKAVATWEEAVGLGGDEGQAAAFRLAEMKLEKDPKGAADAFIAALRSVTSSGEYHNPFVPIEEARALLERTVQACRTAGDAAAAKALGEAYARLALPGRDDELAAQTADAAAMAALEKAKASTDPQPALEEQARESFKQAGMAYERAASKVEPGADQAKWLWSSADRYLKAQQLSQARDVLGKLTAMEGILGPESLAEAWFKIAQTHQLLQQNEAARAAFKRGLQPDGPYLLRSRHELAILDLKEGKFDDAEAGLQENLKTLQAAAQPDATLREATLYALAEVAFQRQEPAREELRDYSTAEQRLLRAIAEYGDGSPAIRARMMLARCYWFNAVLKSRALTNVSLSDEERKQYARQYADNLTKSLEQYEKVEMVLSVKQSAGGLTADETVHYKHAQFWGSDCYFYLRKYDEALRRYQALALRYRQQPEELIALSQVRNIYYETNDTEKMATAQSRVREAIEKMPEIAWSGAAPTHQKSFWLKWLDDATKPATP
ncbi:MAG: hypothetical protein U0746_05570 [Gemmataceae bacterium]